MNRRGFSLLEVMVAISILGIAIVALFQLFSVNLRSVKKTEDYSKALVYARSLMDDAYAITELTDKTESYDFKDGFRGSRTIRLKSTDENNIKIYEISATVSWPPSGGLEIKGLRTYYDPGE